MSEGKSDDASVQRADAGGMKDQSSPAAVQRAMPEGKSDDASVQRAETETAKSDAPVQRCCSCPADQMASRPSGTASVYWQSRRASFR